MRLFCSIAVIALLAPSVKADVWTKIVGNGIAPIGDGFGAGGVPSASYTGFETMNCYDGCFYAGADTTSNSITVWRSCDLINWTNVLSGLPPHIFDMQSNTNGIFFGAGGGQTWKSTNGVDWVNFTIGHGYVQAGNFSAEITLRENMIYMATANNNGTQVWKRPADGSANWTKVLDFATGLGSADGAHPGYGELFVYCPPSAPSAVFVTGGDTNGNFIYQTADGGVSWHRSTAIGNSFQVTGNQYIASLIEFNGQLYAGTGNDTGAQMWRTPIANATNWSSTTPWEKVVSAGFGYTHTEFHRFAIAGGKLRTFLFSHNILPARVWGSLDGSNWVQSNPDSFGMTNTVWNGALAAYTGNDGTPYLIWGGGWTTPTNTSVTLAQLWATQLVCPSLQIQTMGGSSRISWPGDALGFSLETSTDISNPAWSPPNYTISRSNNQDSVTISNTGTRFFRLHQTP